MSDDDQEPCDPPGDFTRLLGAHRAGDPEAAEQLISLAYPELRRIARRQLRRGRPGQTLNTTGLVHEVYVKLADRAVAPFADRTHFFALMARTMRQVIVDEARRRSAEKRGGGEAVLSLDEARAASTDPEAEGMLELDAALERLRDVDERLVRVVECRFFAGYTEEETAEVLDLSVRTVQRTWRRSRAWLREELSGASV